MNLKQTIQNKYDRAIYGYTPGEFLPIFVDGKLLNKSEFVAYKLGKAFMRFSDRFDAIRENMEKL
jgi:hypothetical protein